MGGEDSSAGKSSDVYKREDLSSHMCMYAHRYMEHTHSPPLLPDFFEKVSVQNEMFPLNSFSSGLRLNFSCPSRSLGIWHVFNGLCVFTKCDKMNT